MREEGGTRQEEEGRSEEEVATVRSPLTKNN